MELQEVQIKLLKFIHFLKTREQKMSRIILFIFAILHCISCDAYADFTVGYGKGLMTGPVELVGVGQSWILEKSGDQIQIPNNAKPLKVRWKDQSNFQATISDDSEYYCVCSFGAILYLCNYDLACE